MYIPLPFFCLECHWRNDDNNSRAPRRRRCPAVANKKTIGTFRVTKIVRPSPFIPPHSVRMGRTHKRFISRRRLLTYEQHKDEHLKRACRDELSLFLKMQHRFYDHLYNVSNVTVREPDEMTHFLSKRQCIG